jgi:formiminotetrahydrofolate cyclodeaminase
MLSDLTTAKALARAAVDGALANVEINLEPLKDQALAQGLTNRMASVKG